jgi:2-oxoglutarate ferredoxin oxidoreductase subunit delta
VSKVTVFSQSCKGFEECGLCSFVCPKHLFTAGREINRLGYVPSAIEDQEKCTGCQNCMIYCPDLAIVVEKEAGDKPAEEDEAND